MTTQRVLDKMRDETQQLRDALNGKTLKELNQKLSKTQLALQNIKHHCENLTAILDECDAINPGIVSQAALQTYKKVYKTDVQT